MIVVRTMQIEDVDQVCVLEEEAFSMPWHKQSFLEMIAHPDALYLVAENREQPGKILGCCGVRNIVGEGEITNVVVKKESRNEGTGRKLLTELLRRGMKELGISAFTLEVRVGNAPAIHLYESLGFISEGIRKNFYEKPREDAMIMWKR